MQQHLQRQQIPLLAPLLICAQWDSECSQPRGSVWQKTVCLRQVPPLLAQQLTPSQPNQCQAHAQAPKQRIGMGHWQNALLLVTTLEDGSLGSLFGGDTTAKWLHTQPPIKPPHTLLWW